MEQEKKTFPVEPEGVLIVNKHCGVTSHDIVGDIRHIYRTRKVGHTGTLDPMAEGVLVILVGRAAKAAEYLVSDQKSYRATLRLGITTDTEDTTGTVLSTAETLPSPEAVQAICGEQFVGKILQIPPMYSALKVNGQKLCDLARQGIEVERKAREIEILSLTCTPIEGSASDYILDVTCSSGTYIRTLCADIGRALGCGGAMASLCRTMAGGYHIEDAVRIESLREESAEALLGRLLPIESLFSTLPALSFPAFYERLIRNGCSIAQKKLRIDYPEKQQLRLIAADGSFFGLGEVRETEEGLAVKCIKFFQI